MTSPVLFLIFNRPDITAQSFESIRNARPPRLYIAADGPRPDRPGEEDLCMQTRKIADAVDWPCEVRTLFRKRNLGCSKGVATAVSWFFGQEEEGIIYEDDIVAHPDFFTFCAAMLERWRNDERVMHISGMNMQFGIRRGDASYYFSDIMHCWGWASWRRAWQKFDYSMSGLAGFMSRELPEKFTSPAVIAHFRSMLRRVRDDKIDTWDTRWNYSIWKAGGLCLQSNVNMIKNIGFSDSATHTTGLTPLAFLEPHPMGKLVHTDRVEKNEQADALTCRISFAGRPDGFEAFFAEALLRLESRQVPETLHILDIMRECYGEHPLLMKMYEKSAHTLKYIKSMKFSKTSAKIAQEESDTYIFFEKPVIGISVADVPHKEHPVFSSEHFILPKLKDIFGNDHQNIYAVNAEIPDMHIREFKKAFCITSNEEILTSDGRVILEYTSQKTNPLLNNILKKTNVIKLNNSIGHLSLAGLEHNYYHHMIEYLSRYMLLSESGIKPDYYVMSTKTKFQQQWLELLEIDQARVIPTDTYTIIQAENLIVPDLTNNWEPIEYGGYESYAKQWIPSWHVDSLRKKILGKFYAEDSIYTHRYAKKIYISRKAANYRKILNEEELMPILKKYNFAIYMPEELSVKDQITLFSNADIILGIHGAGLANILFADKNAKMLEIFPQYYLDQGISILSKVIGIAYFYMVGHSININNVHPQKKDFIIEPGEFDQAIDILLHT
jgi:hypothetical protein